MIEKPGRQARYFALIKKVNGATKWDIFDALMSREAQVQIRPAAQNQCNTIVVTSPSCAPTQISKA